jgi:hypothetical protein
LQQNPLQKAPIEIGAAHERKLFVITCCGKIDVIGLTENEQNAIKTLPMGAKPCISYTKRAEKPMLPNH